MHQSRQVSQNGLDLVIDGYEFSQKNGARHYPHPPAPSPAHRRRGDGREHAVPACSCQSLAPAGMKPGVARHDQLSALRSASLRLRESTGCLIPTLCSPLFASSFLPDPLPKLAYLINVYPAPSHSFIRREIRAHEALGFSVERYSIRRTESPLRDPEDQEESTQTKFLLDASFLRLLLALLVTSVRSPGRFLRTLNMAWKLGRRSERGLLYHGIYLAEACLLRRRLAQDQVQHLHAHFGTNSATVAILCFLLGGPSYSFTVHGPEEFDKATLLGLEDKIQHASFVVAISSFGRSQLYRWCDNRHWPRIHVVHCGLDASYLEREHPPLSDSNRFVCIGRLCEQKGQLLLVDAFARLVIARDEPTPKLVLVGDGPMRSQIEARIRELGIEANVRITGWASGEVVQQEIAAARTMVLPSFAEGLPVVIMEALAMERPVISTSIAGIPELVVPGENGWLVPAGDIDPLVEAMKQALNTSVERLQEMGRAGRARVLKRHNIQTEVAKLAELFKTSV
jgi:colanic acid/amylovoran biosynthesis glycosyltransferase